MVCECCQCVWALSWFYGSSHWLVMGWGFEWQCISVLSVPVMESGTILPSLFTFRPPWLYNNYTVMLVHFSTIILFSGIFLSVLDSSVHDAQDFTSNSKMGDMWTTGRSVKYTLSVSTKPHFCNVWGMRPALFSHFKYMPLNICNCLLLLLYVCLHSV